MDKERASLLTESGLWMTQNKELIPVKDMSDGHLLNTLRLLRRVANSHLDNQIKMYLNAPPLLGEMAQDAFDREFDELTEKDWKALYNEEALDVLLSEAHKRGLKWESETISLWV